MSSHVDVNGHVERLASAVVSKTVEIEAFKETVPREVEDVYIERSPAADGDSGEIETLADGSVSIPVFEEEIVVTKRLVVRERVIVRKRTSTEPRLIKAELRRERIELAAGAAATTTPKEKQ